MRTYITFSLALLAHLLLGQQRVSITPENGMDSADLVIKKGDIELSGTVYPEQGIVLGALTTEKPGAIKFENGEFFGYDGSEWISLSLNRKKEILGPSAIATDGAISYNGKTGLEAADAICKISYPNEPSAHFYNVNEVDEAISNGAMGTLSQNTNYWVMSSNYRFRSSSATPSTFEAQTRLNNCYNYLSSGSFNSERGTSFSYYIGVPYSGQLSGIIGNYANNVTCNSTFFLVCGR